MKSKKGMTPEARMRNTKKWLMREWPNDLLAAYCRRFKVSNAVAEDELARLGYWDQLQTQSYEQQGIEYEYLYDGYSGSMKVVPKGTPEWELFQF